MTTHDTADHSALLRRDFLKVTGGVGALMAAQGVDHLGPVRAESPPLNRNVIIFITDQEQALQWFPEGWAEANLPCLTRLRSKGVSFERAYTNTAMCTPARNTLFTGLYPAQHLGFDTLTEGFVQSEAELQLNPTLPHLGAVMTNAGYEVAFIGKYHLSKGIDRVDGVHVWDDIERYEFKRWSPPDAGRNTALSDYGGGFADHDTRFVGDALAYLEEKVNAPGGKPFCLVMALVNPHDVLGYPNLLEAGGYTNNYGGVADWLAPTTPPIGLPPTVTEDLANNFKPTAHLQFLVKSAGLGTLETPQKKNNYLNFYGNLLKLVDSQYAKILDFLDGSAAGRYLLDQTWIVRTTDHGDHGMAHGGLRQKSFTVYEEAPRVPLVWSNPIDFPTGKVCEELVSHVDFLPTLCSVLGIDTRAYGMMGTDYSALIRNPAGPPVQERILFTYDDIWAGQNASGSPQGIVNPPNRIQAIREKDFVYAYYFDGDGVEAPQSEFYDLRTRLQGGTDFDPLTGQPVQLINLSSWAEDTRVAAGQAALITPALRAKRTAMESTLVETVKVKLVPRPVQSAVPPENLQVERLIWKDTAGVDHTDLQITWISRITTQYQLQYAADLKAAWTNVGDPVRGNNGPMVLTQAMVSSGGYYRLSWSAAVPDSPVPVREYTFANGLEDAAGSGVAAESLGGTVTNGSYVFGPAQGLRVPLAGLDLSEYSIEFEVTLNSTQFPFCKLIDFSNLAQDFGLYRADDGRLWTFPDGRIFSTALLPLNTPTVVRLARNKTSKTVGLSINGVQQWFLNDVASRAVSPSDGVLTFFVDDVVTNSVETCAGSVSYIRILNTSAL